MPKPRTPCLDCGDPTHGVRCRLCYLGFQAKPNPLCTTAECGHLASSPQGGTCKVCNQWSNRNGGADPNGRYAPRPKRTCDVIENGERCGRPHKSKGMCEMHAQRKRNHGSPLFTLNRPKNTLHIELRAAAHATTDECIYLDGYKNRPVIPYGGKSMKASRAVWIIRYGDPGPDLHVRHICSGGSGEAGCINIRHLCTGTPFENAIDKVLNGRSIRGEDTPNARLTRGQVRTIRQLYATNRFRQKELAAMFQVSPNAVSLAIRRKTWAWVD